DFCGGAWKMAEQVGVLLYFAPRSAISRRDTQEESMTRKFYPAFISLLICYFLAAAATPYSQKTGAPPPKLPTMREQAEIQQQWLRLRLERALPEVMSKDGVSMGLRDGRAGKQEPRVRSLAVPH